MRAPGLGLALVALIAASSAPFARAMFQDQAGTFDWYKQHVGIVTTAAFDPAKPRVCVATEQGVVACLNLRDGSIVWRKLVASSAPALLLDDDRNLLLVAGDGVVRSFDLEGALKWERRLPSAAPATLTRIAPSGETGSRLLVQQGSTYTLLDVRRGSQVAAGASPFPAAAALTAADLSGTPLLLGVEPGSSELLTAEVSKGDAPAPRALAAAAASGGGDGDAGGDSSGSSSSSGGTPPLGGGVVGSAAGVAVLSADGAALCWAAADEDGALAPALACTPVAVLAPQLAPASGLALASSGSGWLLYGTGGEGAALLAPAPAAEGGALRAVGFFPSVCAASGPVAAGEAGAHAVGLLDCAAPGSLTLTVVSSASGAVLLSETAAVPALEGRLVVAPGAAAPPLSVRSLRLGTYRKRDKATGFRAVASLSDGRLAMLQQGLAVWVRDEAAAGVRCVLLADLPATRAGVAGLGGEAAGGPRPDLATRLRYQLLGAKVQLKLASSGEEAELLALRDGLSDRNRRTRDVNGFRKMLLATTTTGRLLALHNGNGAVLWSRPAPPASAGGAAAAPSALLPWRTYHDTQHAPEVLALSYGNGAGGAQPYGAVLNAHTGEELARLDLTAAAAAGGAGHEVVRVTPLTTLHDGSAEQRVYLVLLRRTGGGTDGALAAAPLPDTPATRAYLAAHHSAHYVFTRGGDDEQEGGGTQGGRGGAVLAGYGFTRAPGGGGGAPALAETWRLAVPGRLLAVAVRDPTEPIQSSVKVLADRTIKVRYLNPNLALVAWQAPPPGDAAGDAPGGGPSELGVALVDTASGRLLHAATHVGARGPVTAVLSENLAVYWFWDDEAARPVAASLELYDATPRDFSVLDYLFNPNATRPASSFAAPPLEVVSQVFYSRLVPVAATATRTEQGITPKQLLLATNTDQVYALDRRWVDPRRPKKAKLTQDEMEEGLLPFSDTLPLSPLQFATLDKQVLGLRQLVVEPTRLESTCLLLVTGVDLFYTRLSPARAFDSLEDDFNYGLLLAALAGLGAGAAVMHMVAKQAALAQKWK